MQHTLATEFGHNLRNELRNETPFFLTKKTNKGTRSKYGLTDKNVNTVQQYLHGSD